LQLRALKIKTNFPVSVLLNFQLQRTEPKSTLNLSNFHEYLIYSLTVVKRFVKYTIHNIHNKLIFTTNFQIQVSDKIMFSLQRMPRTQLRSQGKNLKNEILKPRKTRLIFRIRIYNGITRNLFYNKVLFADGTFHIIYSWSTER
jgi:hypothetical protein